MTIPQQIHTSRSLGKKLECDTYHGTVATASDGSSSLSSGYLSPESSTAARPDGKKWSFAYGWKRRRSIRHVRNTIRMFAAFVFFSLLHFMGLHTLVLLDPIQPPTVFDTLNPNPNWCPFATCHNSPICHPCDRKFLVVIATGRSGSTTLINMLDLLPGVRMAGENNGHLTYGFRAMGNLRSTEDFHLRSRKEVKGAWRHHPIPEQASACPIQGMFEAMNPPSERDMGIRGYDDGDEIIGFKTVRFHDVGQFGESPERSVEFLTETFPCARFIINVRGDIEAQKHSWLKAFGKKMEGDTISVFNRRLNNVSALLGQDRARLIDMSEWSKEDGSGLHVLNDTIRWLGFEGCRFPYLLHSNKDGYDSDNQKYSLGDHCRKIGR